MLKGCILNKALELQEIKKKVCAWKKIFSGWKAKVLLGGNLVVMETITRLGVNNFNLLLAVPNSPWRGLVTTSNIEGKKKESNTYYISSPTFSIRNLVT